jgi:hypothetical protein
MCLGEREMEENKEAIIAKIMKLMELGNEEKNSNSHERDAASKMAAKLMANYSIDFIDLKNHKIKDDPFMRIDVEGSSPQRVDYEGALAHCIALAFDCKMINTFRTGRWEMAFMGSKHDLEIAVYFFKFLRRTLFTMSYKNITAESLKAADGYLGKKITAKYLEDARRNYCFGLVATISERLDDLYKKREEFIPSDCRDLVIVRKDDLQKYVKECFPIIKHTRAKDLKGDLNAYRKGVSDGHKVNLSRPLPNHSTPNSQLGG